MSTSASPPPPSDVVNPHAKPHHYATQRPVSPNIYHSLDRPSRSASPAPSVSSTLAAERLARLTDAQVADLAAQVSSESYRRRTPVGALLAAYEFAGQKTRATGGGSAASRLSLMSNDQFRILANDLDAEALRRDIPGIDTLGRSRAGSVISLGLSRSNSTNAERNGGSEPLLARDITLRAAKFAPGNAAAAEAMAAISSPLSSSPSSTNPNGIQLLQPAAGSSLNRSLSSSSLSSLPTRMIPVGAGPAAASMLAQSSPTSAASPTPASVTNLAAVSSNPSGPSPMAISASLSSLTAPAAISPSPASAAFLARSQSATALNAAPSHHPDDDDPDRTISRSRLGGLPDPQFAALRRDLAVEMERRRNARRGLGGGSDDEDAVDDVDVAGDAAGPMFGNVAGRKGSKSSRGGLAGDGGEYGDFAASVLAAVSERTGVIGLVGSVGSGQASPMGSEGSPLRNAVEGGADDDNALAEPAAPGGVKGRHIVRAHTAPQQGVVGVSPPSARVEELMRAMPSQDLWRLWDDAEHEAGRRAAGGIVVVPVAVEVERERKSKEDKREKEDRERRKGEKEREKKEKEGKEAREAREAANVAAWRSRIAKLTDEQMAEVTTDVYDEMTRRRDKSGPFLAARADLSQKRNEARKELSRLPSRELKLLWSIIHESMKKRKMV
ncbi:hypothetical protein HK101_001379 [Irineochytrium annulatum]|nr:hypothetical protein HK101_001379 [Irineochytrium annulatum]